MLVTLGETTNFNLDHLSSSFPCRKCSFFWKKTLVIWREKNDKKISKNIISHSLQLRSLLRRNSGGKKLATFKTPNFFGGCFNPQKIVDLENIWNFGDGVFDHVVLEFCGKGAMEVWNQKCRVTYGKYTTWLKWMALTFLVCRVIFFGVHI